MYTAVNFKNYFISHVAKNKIMTDGKHKFMHLKWTAPDGQNVTGNSKGGQEPSKKRLVRT